MTEQKRTIETQIRTEQQKTQKNTEKSLRPTQLDDYIGQERIKHSLGMALTSAKKRKDQLSHVLLYGPPGLGKTTLANIIANEMDSPIVTTVGSNLEKAADVAALLNNIVEGSIVFIDEIHRMDKAAEECLYSAMEDGFITITIGSADQAKTVKLTLPKFTLIGATTRPGMLSAPLRDRFIYQYKMEYYTDSELREIAEITLTKMGIKAEYEVRESIAKISRGTPRIVNKNCILLRDFAVSYGIERFPDNMFNSFLTISGINADGLTNNDILLLTALFQADRPVGLATLSHIMGEDEQTIEDVYEPYLIYNQYITKTPRGRELTPKGREYLETTGAANETNIIYQP